MRLPKPLRGAIQFAGLHYIMTRELLDSGAAFNPLDPRYRSNPYPLYRNLREKDPIHKSRLGDMHVFTRHADIVAILKDPHFSADDRKGPGFEKQRAEMAKKGLLEAEEVQTPSMLRLDPPDHTRLRSLVNKAFTPRAVESLRPRVEAIVDEIVERAASAGRMEVIDDLAYPLPVIVIAEMLGIPPEDRDRFKRWSDDLARTVDFETSEDEMRRAQESGKALDSYLKGIAEERRREPREDLISALLAAEQAGDKLSIDEFFSTCQLLLVAGNETTTNLIGNGLLALLNNPAQMDALRREPDLIPDAVEELLRYDAPVQATSRILLDDVEFGETKLAKGSQAILLLGAANRDPAQFDHAEDLDVRREDIRHMAFGQGIHYCLGAPLARMEAPIALNALLQRFPDLRLSRKTRPQWGKGVVLHGLKRLAVEF